MSTKSELFSAGSTPKFPNLKGVWRFHMGAIREAILEHGEKPHITIRETSEGLKLFRQGYDETILPLTRYSEFKITSQGGALRVTDPEWITIESIRAYCEAQELHKGEFWLLVFK